LSGKRINVGLKLLYVSFLALLTGCGGSQDNDKATSGAFDEDKFTTDRGFYIHIKADLEVIKTGENLNFDYVIYVISCYNREVRGSFSGILKPKIMFKAISTGEAVAIVPPEHYCERGLRNYALERPGDSMVIPQVTWYPDVNDLSFAISYMSDSAYRNPNAHLKFKSYSYAPTDKAAFVENIPTVMCGFTRCLKSLSPLYAACQMGKPVIIARGDERMMCEKAYLIYVTFEK